MLTLTPAERSWRQAYQTHLKTEFPGCVKEISIFGSKARGDGLDTVQDVSSVYSCPG